MPPKFEIIEVTRSRNVSEGKRERKRKYPTQTIT